MLTCQNNFIMKLQVKLKGIIQNLFSTVDHNIVTSIQWQDNSLQYQMSVDMK